MEIIRCWIATGVKCDKIKINLYYLYYWSQKNKRIICWLNPQTAFNPRHLKMEGSAKFWSRHSGSTQLLLLGAVLGEADWGMEKEGLPFPTSRGNLEVLHVSQPLLHNSGYLPALVTGGFFAVC